jgi:hypothetical protein
VIAPRRDARVAADPGLALRKARDTALAVPLVGVILLMPPVAQIFAVEGRIFGLPVAVAYVFGVWLALIVAARRTGRWIIESEAGAGSPPAPEPDRDDVRPGEGPR